MSRVRACDSCRRFQGCCCRACLLRALQQVEEVPELISHSLNEVGSLFANAGLGVWHRQAEQMAAKRLAALNLLRRAAPISPVRPACCKLRMHTLCVPAPVADWPYGSRGHVSVPTHAHPGAVYSSESWSQA